MTTTPIRKPLPTLLAKPDQPVGRVASPTEPMDKFAHLSTDELIAWLKANDAELAAKRKPDLPPVSQTGRVVRPAGVTRYDPAETEACRQQLLHEVEVAGLTGTLTEYFTARPANRNSIMTPMPAKASPEEVARRHHAGVWLKSWLKLDPAMRLRRPKATVKPVAEPAEATGVDQPSVTPPVPVDKAARRAAASAEREDLIAQIETFQARPDFQAIAPLSLADDLSRPVAGLSTARLRDIADDVASLLV